MDLINKQISPESNAKVVVSGGQLVLSVDLNTEGIKGVASVAVDVDYFLDELAAKIPGQVDDMVIAVLKSALKAL